MNGLGTILLIDDDTICSYLNQQLLEEVQVAERIVCLSSGQAALDYLKKANAFGGAYKSKQAAILPDLIFLDISMPGMDGFDVLDCLMNAGGSRGFSAKRVIMLSTSMHPVDQKRASNYDVFDYLVKPLTETKIKSVIDRFLQSLQQEANDQVKTPNPLEVKDRPPVERSGAAILKKKQKEKKG